MDTKMRLKVAAQGYVNADRRAYERGEITNAEIDSWIATCTTEFGTDVVDALAEACTRARRREQARQAVIESIHTTRRKIAPIDFNQEVVTYMVANDYADQVIDKPWELVVQRLVFDMVIGRDEDILTIRRDAVRERLGDGAIELVEKAISHPRARYLNGRDITEAVCFAINDGALRTTKKDAS